MRSGSTGDFEGFIARQDGSAVVVLAGDVDLAVVDSLNALVDQAFDVSPRVVIDMADVSFLDSSGLGVLVARIHRAGDTGSLTVRNASESIARVFRLTGVDRHITLHQAPPN